jgi:hypothetical protein
MCKGLSSWSNPVKALTWHFTSAPALGLRGHVHLGSVLVASRYFLSWWLPTKQLCLFLQTTFPFTLVETKVCNFSTAWSLIESKHFVDVEAGALAAPACIFLSPFTAAV